MVCATIKVIQKRQCLGCAECETHGRMQCGNRSDRLNLHFSALLEGRSGTRASPSEDFISQDASERGRPEGCVPSAGHDGGVGDFHHGGFHFGLHLQRCVFPQRQQQRRPRRCRVPRRGCWGLQLPSRARPGSLAARPLGLPGRPEGLVTRAAPAPGELLLPGTLSFPGWAHHSVPSATLPSWDSSLRFSKAVPAGCWQCQESLSGNRAPAPPWVSGF